MRLLPRLAAIVLGVAILSTIFAWKTVDRWMDRPMTLQTTLQVAIPEGGNLTQLVNELRGLGVLRHPNWLRLHARLSGAANRVRAGEYQLQPGITPRQLLRKLLAGDVVVYSVTLVEGMTVEQVLLRLWEQPKLRRTLADVNAANLLSELQIQTGFASAEGAFFPDTYNYSLGMSDAGILLVAYKRLQAVLEQEWADRAEGLPYESPYEALIMASLVEKETGVGSERPDIAGVFVRRLRLGMLLQTDPTVIYGLGANFSGNLTRAHLRTPGRYNTYMNRGLPPTPIALPGRAAIHAALHPADGDALYFVARGDGSHQFSNTLSEHNAAVRKYQVLQRARNYRSSPGAD
jgi:UPF0755 protein